MNVSGVASVETKLPAFSKLWRLGSVIPMFWRDLHNDHNDAGNVLHTLVEITTRLLEDLPSASITVYMLDPWLRSVTRDPKEDNPMLFYLGATAKASVEVFYTDEKRAEPPRLGDLGALPTRNRTTLAVLIQMPTSHRRMAMIQVVVPEEKNDKGKTQTTERTVLKTTLTQDLETESKSGFTDSQLMYIQLCANVAGGILEQLKEVESKHRLLDRMHSCVDVSVAINQARSLADFEQRVKTLLGNFFGVTTVRVLFYDSSTDELLISSAQMKRKGVSRVTLDKGVVGLCASRQTVVHVGNISHHPYIDAGADGLQRSGRPVSSEASMLVGPLVIDSVEGSMLFGVIQLLERRKRKPGDAMQSADLKGEEFSAEEQSLFTQLLRVCAQAAWRTFKVQELTSQVNDKKLSLVDLLAGA